MPAAAEASSNLRRRGRGSRTRNLSCFAPLDFDLRQRWLMVVLRDHLGYSRQRAIGARSRTRALSVSILFAFANPTSTPLLRPRIHPSPLDAGNPARPVSRQHTAARCADARNPAPRRFLDTIWPSSTSAGAHSTAAAEYRTAFARLLAARRAHELRLAGPPPFAQRDSASSSCKAPGKTLVRHSHLRHLARHA